LRVSKSCSNFHFKVSKSFNIIAESKIKVDIIKIKDNSNFNKYYNSISILALLFYLKQVLGPSKM